jgi:hypothetical protein
MLQSTKVCCEKSCACQGAGSRLTRWLEEGLKNLKAIALDVRAHVQNSVAVTQQQGPHSWIL